MASTTAAQRASKHSHVNRQRPPRVTTSTISLDKPEDDTATPGTELVPVSDAATAALAVAEGSTPTPEPAPDADTPETATDTSTEGKTKKARRLLPPCCILCGFTPQNKIMTVDRCKVPNACTKRRANLDAAAKDAIRDLCQPYFGTLTDAQRAVIYRESPVWDDPQAEGTEDGDATE